jgi:addiction module RelE/StbE family toxin
MTKPIIYTKQFKKQFRARILPYPKLKAKFYKRIELFVHDKDSSLLRDHVLKGHLQYYRSFSIANDLRVIYQEYDDSYLFMKIGTHNQVY